jgi:DNA (cytosine-5)-methyltransferase 1
VDLFAGAGGFSLAANEVGWHIIAAVELNKHAATTYRHNLCINNQQSHLHEGSILDLKPEVFAKSLLQSHGPCDVVLGGPPWDLVSFTGR